MTDLSERWQKFEGRPFPSRYSGKLVGGVDLEMLHLCASGALKACAESGRCDEVNAEILGVCRAQLAEAMPELSGRRKGYFEELDALISLALAEPK